MDQKNYNISVTFTAEKPVQEVVIEYDRLEKTDLSQCRILVGTLFQSQHKEDVKKRMDHYYTSIRKRF
jgi:hypothetical protein